MQEKDFTGTIEGLWALASFGEERIEETLNWLREQNPAGTKLTTESVWQELLKTTQQPLDDLKEKFLQIDPFIFNDAGIADDQFEGTSFASLLANFINTNKTKKAVITHKGEEADPYLQKDYSATTEDEIEIIYKENNTELTLEEEKILFDSIDADLEDQLHEMHEAYSRSITTAVPDWRTRIRGGVDSVSTGSPASSGTSTPTNRPETPEPNDKPTPGGGAGAGRLSR